MSGSQQVLFAIGVTAALGLVRLFAGPGFVGPLLVVFVIVLLIVWLFAGEP